ncbi:MAG: glycosyltransferase [Bacteroidales bacterium]|nr:glycosyltransferase [Bacteroidales bacterium]
MSIKATVIISFYNNINALSLILSALNKQSISQFEAIIADDGSKPQITQEVTSMLDKYNYPIKHVWHEDKGFRKNRILNKAILASESAYIIFVDGDCIPHKSFVEDHLFFSQENRIVAGRRVLMSERLSARVNEPFIEKGKLFSFKFHLALLFDSLRKKSRHVESAIYIPITSINKKFGNRKRGVKGCNFSVHKKGLLEINGFDMRYELPCVGEDTDIEYRLKLLGYDVFLPKFRLVQYHLYHKPLSRIRVKENDLIFSDTIKNKTIKANSGLNQLSKNNRFAKS